MQVKGPSEIPGEGLETAPFLSVLQHQSVPRAAAGSTALGTRESGGFSFWSHVVEKEKKGGSPQE